MKHEKTSSLSMRAGAEQQLASNYLTLMRLYTLLHRSKLKGDTIAELKGD